MANTLPIWFAGYKNTFAKYEIEVTNEIIAREVLGDWEGPKRLGIVNEEEFFAELENEVMEQLNEAKLNPDVLQILTLIKQSGGKIGVVTASKKRWVKGALRNNDLRDLVDVFLGREDVEFVKPDPESLLKAINLMGAKKEETVMVGDSQKDVLAAKRAGVDSCLYFPKKYSEFYNEKTQMSLGATYVIDDFSELKRFLVDPPKADC